MASKRKLDDGYCLAVQTLHMSAPRFTGRSTVIVARKWHPGWPGNKGKLDSPREHIVSKKATIEAVKKLLATEYLVSAESDDARAGSGGGGGGGAAAAGTTAGTDMNPSTGEAPTPAPAPSDAPPSDSIMVAKWSRFINPGKPLSGVNAKTLNWDAANVIPGTAGTADANNEAAGSSSSSGGGGSGAAAATSAGAADVTMQLCGREFGYRDDCIVVHCTASSYATAKREITAAKARRMKALDDAVTAATAAVAQCRGALIADGADGDNAAAAAAAALDNGRGDQVEVENADAKPEPDAPGSNPDDAAAAAAAAAFSAVASKVVGGAELCDEIQSTPKRYTSDGRVLVKKLAEACFAMETAVEERKQAVASAAGGGGGGKKKKVAKRPGARSKGGGSISSSSFGASRASARSAYDTRGECFSSLFVSFRFLRLGVGLVLGLIRGFEYFLVTCSFFF